MLAICSDLDGTPDSRTYFETLKYLNTDRMTALGPGVGLEVGNTIYFDMPPSEFSYWNTDDAGRALIAERIQSGHIDCLHSYGDGATRRRDVQRALDALARQKVCLNVWIDHGRAPTNFGKDIMQGRGDIPSSAAYHADVSCDFGIQFVWLGRVTSVIGQNRSWRLSGIYNPQRRFRSMLTALKEAAKGLGGAIGSAKYAMHPRNRILREARLRDGRRVLEFMRCNPHWRGSGDGATADGIAEVLKPAMLDRLVERQGVSILYTHLGKPRRSPPAFSSQTARAFERLASYVNDKKILVATTRRVLAYLRAVDDLVVKAERLHGRSIIHLASRYPKDLGGITLYTEDADRAVLTVNGAPAERFDRHPPDRLGRGSISIPWTKLEYPL
jgi:hypothetical protein